MTDIKIFCFDLQITQYIAAVPFDKNIKKAIFIVAQVKTQKTSQNICAAMWKDTKFTLCKETSEAEWEEITEIYWKNKKQELAVIKVQDFRTR